MEPPLNLADLLQTEANSLARWFDRTESVVVLSLGADGRVEIANSAFLKRSGRLNQTSSLVFEDLLALPAPGTGELLLSPRYGAPVQQLLRSRGDDSQWMCTLFEVGNGRRLLVGNLLVDNDLGRSREEDGLVADIAAFGRRLQHQNRQLATQKEEVDVLLRTDPLCGVASRRALDERITTELERVTRYGSVVSVVVCDIDHFKRVNDEHGHAAGDTVLAIFGRILRESCRPVDLPARPGGEEFIVLVPDTGLEGAAALAERIRVLVASTIIDDIGRAVTVSFGVAQHRRGESKGDWLERADAALYRAKEGGRNRVALAAEVDEP
jgi:diguanylate cyclase (GGDEF)-like protein